MTLAQPIQDAATSQAGILAEGIAAQLAHADIDWQAVHESVRELEALAATMRDETAAGR